MDPETAVLSFRRGDGSILEYTIQGPVDLNHREGQGRFIIDFNPEDLTLLVIHPPQKETTS